MRKKLVAVCCVFVLLLSAFPMVYAQEGAGAVSVEFTAIPENLFIRERVSVTAVIHSEETVTGAMARWLFAGQEIAGYKNTNFTVEDGRTSTLHFVVPEGLPLGSDQVFAFEITLPDGRVVRQEIARWLNGYTPRLSVSFPNVPAEIEEGQTAYFTARIHVEYLPGRVFSVPVRFMKNGEVLWSDTKTMDIYDGMEYTVAFTAGARGARETVSCLVNPDGIWGVDQMGAEASASVVNSEYERKVQEVLKKVNPVVVTAVTTKNTLVYADSGLKTPVGSLSAFTNLTYLHPDSGYIMKAGRVIAPNGQTYWVPMGNIQISTKNYTIADTLSFEEKEMFVNGKGYISDTYYLVWVNLERQRVNIYLGTQGHWKILKSFPCATGRNPTPTPTEDFIYTSLTSIWRFDNYYVAPVLNLRNGYAFHSQPTYYNGNIKDGTMGRPASLGCIRLYACDVEWMKAWVPVGTKVIVY